MSKDFKRCPRCNTKTPINLHRCGNCGLNYEKFNSATNAEAKSAFRMGEKSRVLYSKNVPSDINKTEIFFKALLGGWFGLHHFSIGKLWRGLVQIIGTIFAFVYSYGTIVFGITSGYLGYLLIICGMVWVYSFITWLSDSLAILFNRFKYPVSLPYKNAEVKQNFTKIAKQENAQNANDLNEVKQTSTSSPVSNSTPSDNSVNENNQDKQEEKIKNDNNDKISEEYKGE